MKQDMPHSAFHIQKALEIINSARGKSLSFEALQKMAVELAAHMLEEAIAIQTPSEKKRGLELARMMDDKLGKAFTTQMTDECFRSHSRARVASQMIYLIEELGIPLYLEWPKQLALKTFQFLGKNWGSILVPLAVRMLRRETRTVILPGEKRALLKHMEKRQAQGVRLNLNHLGEAILGEEEAKRRLQTYLHDLRQSEVEYVSIKISTIFSQINLIGWEETLDALAKRLRELYRAAQQHEFIRPNGLKSAKFVNLDMEEYRDVRLTIDLFKKVLSEPEFHPFSAGIVLQAYLPEAHALQKELTTWAMERIKKGGAPIKIRIVKGANLAMEQFEASIKGWPQAPYRTKIEVDANYKRMATYGCEPEHAKAAHLGIASHNLFDIAYALLLRAAHGVEKEVSFEMLEGMADHLRRVVQQLSQDILLYCPVATKDDFQSAVAYLIRRLDENTGPDNFLRHTFGLKPGTAAWKDQASLFFKACKAIPSASLAPRRHQSRLETPSDPAADPKHPDIFDNEPDTDFSLPKNREWVRMLMQCWKNKTFDPIPCVIAGKVYHQKEPQGVGHDPANLTSPLYRYSLAGEVQINQMLEHAKKYEPTWAKKSPTYRADLLAKAAQTFRERRGEFIGVMMADGGKVATESDPEISEAIDFAEYYRHSLITLSSCHDIAWKPKGTYLVAPPWNFPISIPAGGILAALAMGNCVIFKPAPETTLSGWYLVNALWDAGIPKEALQFLSCADDPVGSLLIQDSRLNGVILTGATSTARLFLNLRPGLDLAAETGGKNGMIITSLSDRDLAIKDLLQSAFGHSGQKCSAASVAVLEKEVYDDPHFRRHLKDAVESLKVGPAWDPSSKVVPLIRNPTSDLLRGLTTLDEGEEWLVTPKQHPRHPNLWSPGVKWGVKEGSFTHTTELFGPVLGVMRAKDLKHAIQIVNGTPYGLTSGLHSLDKREHAAWLSQIEAGNLYINRTLTGAIVRRQPFGGCKASSYGHGAKAGGPNYVAQFAIPIEKSLPNEKEAVPESIEKLLKLIKKKSLSKEELGLWYGAISHYTFWGHRFKQDHDPSRILGQDNLLQYRPRKDVCLRIQKTDGLLDILRSFAAALACDTPLEISWTSGDTPIEISSELKKTAPSFHFVQESEEAFLTRVKTGQLKRVRLLSPPKPSWPSEAAHSACYLNSSPVLTNGRFELLHYLREVSISYDYHRYGNLGAREGEARKPHH